ncbi:MAG: IS1595 family transposase [Methylibium sp.]|nr:IS1595 family transposase [Methylibium sp.]
MSPVPVNDYPRTWSEFLDWFSSEDACLAYLERLRWPQGFICPSCGSMTGAPYRASRTRLLCKDCGHQSTVTAGTIFDKTRTPLKVWLAAAWYVTNQKQGVSALGLQRVLGLGSYQTAWTMLHRFRRAMVRPDRERLKGVVEVDEAYLAITDRKQPISPAGRKNNTSKVLIVLAVEILQPKGFGRIRLRRIDKDSEEFVVPFVQASVEPGATVKTDGSAAYRSLSELGYEHQRNVMLGSDVPAHVSMAGVHRVASLIKRWILGTHHGSVQPEHLDAYLDEFVFRFNRRTSSSRGMLFYRLMQQAVLTDPVTYADIVLPAEEAAETA